MKLAKSISKAIKEKFGCFLWNEENWVGNVPSEPIRSECGLAVCTPCTPGSWNVIVASTPEGEEGYDDWGSFVNPVEQKYLKLQLGDHLYCEIWKTYSRTLTTTTTITPATTTTPTTTTTLVTTTPANPVLVAITRGVTDDELDFLKKTIAVVVASAEEGTTKKQLAKSIYYAIKEKKGPWNVIVAPTQSTSLFIYAHQYKYLKLQLGDDLYCEIWKAKI